MKRRNTALILILIAFFAVNSYAQTVQREQLISTNEKLTQYDIKQRSNAIAAFSLRDYYKSLSLGDIEVRYAQIGVLVDETIQRSSSIQNDIARNLDNYENVRVTVRSKLSELRNTHNLAQKRLNDTIQEVRRVRPAIPRPAQLSADEAAALLSASYGSDALLHYSDAQTERTLHVTQQQIRNGELPDIIASMPSGGTTIIEFNQTSQEQAQPPPTGIIPECTLRLQYVYDAVTGADPQTGSLVALGGSFRTTLPSCMFKIADTRFYNVEPLKKDNSTLYCALPPAVSGTAEAWVIGKGCRESERVIFVVQLIEVE